MVMGLLKLGILSVVVPESDSVGVVVGVLVTGCGVSATAIFSMNTVPLLLRHILGELASTG